MANNVSKQTVDEKSPQKKKGGGFIKSIVSIVFMLAIAGFCFLQFFTDKGIKDFKNIDEYKRFGDDYLNMTKDKYSQSSAFLKEKVMPYVKAGVNDIIDIASDTVDGWSKDKKVYEKKLAENSDLKEKFDNFEKNGIAELDKEIIEEEVSLPTPPKKKKPVVSKEEPTKPKKPVIVKKGLKEDDNFINGTKLFNDGFELYKKASPDLSSKKRNGYLKQALIRFDKAQKCFLFCMNSKKYNNKKDQGYLDKKLERLGMLRYACMKTMTL